MPNLRGKTWTTTTPATAPDAQFWEDHLISDEQNQRINGAVLSVNDTEPDENGNVDIVALPSGGTANQVLTKRTSAAGDAYWADAQGGGTDVGFFIEDGYICQRISSDT